VNIAPIENLNDFTVDLSITDVGDHLNIYDNDGFTPPQLHFILRTV
jgi:hypothetical protein